MSSERTTEQKLEALQSLYKGKTMQKVVEEYCVSCDTIGE
jgi:hypothetical protein